MRVGSRPHQLAKSDTIIDKPAHHNKNRRRPRAASLSGSQAIRVHHIRPGGDEVRDELLLRVVLGMDFRHSPRFTGGADERIERGRHPLRRATGVAPAVIDAGCRRLAPHPADWTLPIAARGRRHGHPPPR